ncbi:hypothetical protein JCM11491_002359 [Sporobolomyces phaffii]
MYSPSRAHSPVHRLHSRPPKSIRRFVPFLSSRQLRVHPVLLVPIFLLGTLWNPFAPSRPPTTTVTTAYEYNPAVAFAQPDAPPLVPDDDDDDPAAFTRHRRTRTDKVVLARTGHGDGADESEWWDPTSSRPDSDAARGIYFEHDGLVYFPSTPSLVAALVPAPEFPPAPALPPPRSNRDDPAAAHRPVPAPLPPVDWFAPGDVFKSPLERAAAVGVSRPRAPAALDAPLPPRPRPVPAPNRRVPMAQRADEDRAALKRKIGANAQKAQWAKKEGKPFVPGKPDELVQKEKAYRRELERKRVDEENARLRQAVWAVVEPPPPRPKVLGLDDDDDVMAGGNRRERDESDGEDLSDEEILEAVRELSPEERSMLSPEEQDVIRELERKYPPTKAGVAQQQRPPQPPPRAAAAAEVRQDQGPGQGQGQKRPNWRDRDRAAAPVEKKKPAAFNPVVPVRAARAGAGQQPEQQQQQQQQQQDAARRRGGLRKRSLDSAAPAVDEDGDAATRGGSDEDETSRFIRRALEEEAEEGGGTPSLSSSGHPGRGPVDRVHPIAYLIDEAEDRWESMLRRQSQTLEQAVEEYVRRYGFRPPVGFDSWWRYAMENRVVLVDEYDQIHDDLVPFRSLAPREFRRRAHALQTDARLPWHRHSFGLGIKAGAVTKVGTPGAGGGTRLEDLMDLLGEFSEMMPEDVEMRFMTGDEPGVVISGEARDRHERFAAEGKYLSASQALETLEPSGYTPWDSLCKPNSTSRRAARALPIDTPSGTNLRSFINHEHGRAIDLCLHPELRDLNGFTSWSGPRPYLLYPMFSFAKTSVHADLLVPSLSNDYYVEVGRDPTWEGKKHNKVLWRGETTGAWHAKASGWRQSQRARLVALANSPRSGDALVHLAAAGRDDSDSDSDSLRRAVAPAAAVAAHYLDVAYAGAPIQCARSNEDDTCAALATDAEARWDAHGGMTPDDENQYKYVLDVDANYPSGKFKRLMSSRSLVFKSTIFPEWWSRRIMPWYHYVPIKSDYSDLVDVAAFFIGAPDGTGAHDLLAKKMALRGQKWSHEHWREVDMAAYMFRLYLEYARLLHRDENDPTSMDYSP